MNRLIRIFLLTSILVGCNPAQTTSPTSPPPDSSQTIISPPENVAAQWWREAIFYEIFVRSFYDSNGDGIGDFNGITQKLDYIQNLGMTAIWLMPIHPSPSYHGYDVLDYYDVNPQYGTMDDFKNLLTEAHKRDIKIIIDLVLNHSSNQHPFFADANNDPQSMYHDWYVWSDKPGNHIHQGKNGNYYGFFGMHMPDLNYNNPDVTAEMQNVTRYWLEDIGVDGFRLDAIKYLIEEGGKIENTASTHEWLNKYYAFYKSIAPETYTVGEVWGAGAFLTSRYAQQVDQIFNFELANGFLTSAQTSKNDYLNSALKLGLKENPDFDFATFLTNHDQNRVMSVLGGDVQKAKLASFLLLTSPGTPFIYYGEEIGMQGEKPDEDIRLPMQWSADANAGFTTGTPWRAPSENFPQVNVAMQDKDPNSLLNLYRSLTKIRVEHPVLREGSLTVLESGNSGVYAILRQDKNENILILINLTETPLSDYELNLKENLLPDGTLTASSLMDTTSAAPLTVNNGTFMQYKPVSELPPYQAYIFQLR